MNAAEISCQIYPFPRSMADPQMPLLQTRYAEATTCRIESGPRWPAFSPEETRSARIRAWIGHLPQLGHPAFKNRNVRRAA